MKEISRFNMIDRDRKIEPRSLNTELKIRNLVRH